MAKTEQRDAAIIEIFKKATLPDWLKQDLEVFVAHADYPLAVRSSSLLEDAQFQPFAGIYRTYMLPNCEPDLSVRLERLVTVCLPYLQSEHLMMLWTEHGYLDIYDYIPGFPAEDVAQLFESAEFFDGIKYASLEWLREMKKK